MFDIGWSEMAIIMLLALIIIGPKDLPRVARTIGQWVRKGRMLAREFQTSLEDMAKETELDDVRKEIEKVGKTDLKKAVENTIDPKGDLKKAFDTTNGGSGEDTVGKVLNGSADAKTGGTNVKAVAAPTPAKAKTPAEQTKPNSAASAKKPASAAKKPATVKTKAAKKPTAPRKPAARPETKSGPKPGTKSRAKPSPKSGTGDTPSSADDSGATMAAKSS